MKNFLSRIAQFIHGNQIVVAAVILFLTVLTYCLFNRYSACPLSEAYKSFVIDRLTGDCFSVYKGVKLTTGR